MDTKTFAQTSNLQKSTTKENIKTGTFKPRNLLDIKNKDERYRHRWLNEANLAKQGYRDPRDWEVVTSESGEAAANKDGSLNAGGLHGTTRVGDLVLGRMPVEQAEARKEYYASKNRLRDEIINMKNMNNRVSDSSGSSVTGGLEMKRGNKTTKDEI